MIVGQSNFLQALGWAVLNSLWQMAFLWVIYQIITGVFKSIKSSQKSYLASSMIMTGFAWFTYTFFSIFTTNMPGHDTIGGGFIAANGNDRLNQWLNTMLPIASMIYLMLLLLPLYYFARNYRYVQAIRKQGLSKVNVQWRIFVKDIAARMGIKKSVHIWLSSIVTSPVTIGYIKPVILLPLAAINQLSTQQLEAVLLHELAHIRRYDYFINLIIRFIQTILYFNPFVKALVKTVEIEREKSCDEMVIQFQYDPHGYASALLMLERNNYRPKPLAVAAYGKKHDLLHRIEYMLGIQKKQMVSFNKLAGMFAGLLCFIALNALLIISKPEKTERQTGSSLSKMASPFYFWNEEGNEAKSPVDLNEMPAPTIVNHIQPKAENPVVNKEEATSTPSQPDEYAVVDQRSISAFPFSAALPLTYVRFVEPEIRQLKEYEKQQVKEALEASKKVLEEKQWKDVETSIADALTSSEKDALKCQYEKELSKVDWSKIKQRLTLAYDNIDWNRVNENLNTALVAIKMDSLQEAYTQTLTELSSIQKELCENNLKAIPDTDISMESIEENKIKVQEAIKTLNKVKTKKIVRL
ncbi:MAG: M56 family metallopeptidase [Chitinophagales bacterium]